MKYLIIGGTGKTGRELIKQGLEQGHAITAMVRTPNKIKQTHPNLTVIKGDVLVPESLENVMSGQDLVLSALGHKRFFIKTSILSRGTENTINAMKSAQVSRLIAISSLGVNDSKYKMGLYYTLFTIPFILYFYFRDKAKQERIICKSGLDWTIVRPAQLTNGKKRTKYKHGDNLGHYVLTKMISRADVAHFMLNLAQDSSYLHKCPGIHN